MNHETGKSRKLNDDDMMQMQTLASDILLMERGQSKAVTGKELSLIHISTTLPEANGSTISLTACSPLEKVPKTEGFAM